MRAAQLSFLAKEQLALILYLNCLYTKPFILLSTFMCGRMWLWDFFSPPPPLPVWLRERRVRGPEVPEGRRAGLIWSHLCVVWVGAAVFPMRTR